MPPTLVLLAALIGVAPGQTIVRSFAGSAANDQVGRALLALPDLDGDGRTEVALSSPLYTAAAGFGSGMVEIRSGATGVLLVRLTGATAGERFGSALARTDTDGDGRDELLVSSPLFSGGQGGAAAGRVSVYSLGTYSPLFSVDGTAAFDRFGTSVVGLPDVNGDGRGDFAVGAVLVDGPAGPNVGAVTLHSGVQGSLIATALGPQPNGEFGRVLASVGDFDGDFRGDLAVGAPDFDGSGGVDCGRVTLLSAALFVLAVRDGASAGQRLGSAIAGLGDVDADFDREIAVGSEGALASAGSVLAFSGMSLASMWTLAGAEPNALLGGALARIGDADGDLVTEIVVGARTDDGPGAVDGGQVILVDGRTGAVRATIQGTAGAQLGFAVAGGSDVDFDGRPEALVAAPFESAGSAMAGVVRAIRLDLAPRYEVLGYPTGTLPEDLALADLDGDGDRDIAVVGSSPPLVRIRWNGGHGGALAPGVFDLLPPTDLGLPSDATPLSIAAFDADADVVAEIAIGRSNGTILRIDGQGSTAAPAFSLIPGSLVVDARPTPGPLVDLAVRGSGPGGRLVAADAGGPFVPGAVYMIETPFDNPFVLAPLASGGSFTAVAIADVDNGSGTDVVAANAGGTLAGGGIHVILSPTWVEAPGSPYPTPGPAVDLDAGALDPDGLANDLLVAETGIGSGGTSVLRDYSPLSGFPAPIATAGFTAARAAVRWRASEAGIGAAVCDGVGRVFTLESWTGSGFGPSTPLVIGSGAIALASAELAAISGPFPCNTEELVVLFRAERAVRIVRRLSPALAVPIAGSGCPAGASVARIGFTGSPVLGDLGFGLTLANATPNAPAYFAIQISPVPGLAPLVFAVAGCGLPFYGTDILLLPAAVSAVGTALFPIPLPNDRQLLCLDFVLLWAIVDGGPIPGGLTLSDALTVRLGEFF